MAFIETRFPTKIAYGASGGPAYSTDIVVVNSGFEQRNSVWADSRCEFDVSHGVKTQTQLNELIAFFRVMKGRANGFRFKDFTDFQVTTGQGVFVALTTYTFQMYRRYTTAATNYDRKITKPVSGSITVTGGSGVSINYTTGVVTVSSGTPTAWVGQFDIPCRFDTDSLKARIEDYNAFSWGSIPVVEIRV